MFCEKEFLWENNDGQENFSMVSDFEDCEDLEEWQATHRYDSALDRDDDVSILEEEDENDLH